MKTSGRSIHESIKYISDVYAECMNLSAMLKQEFSKLLEDAGVQKRYSISGEPKRESWQGDDLSCLYHSLAYSLPLDQEQSETRSYLFFQISLAGDGMEAIDNHEPLIHIGLWEYEINFADDQYMGFPLVNEEEDGDRHIENNVLMCWGNHFEPTWLYTLRLCSVNTLEDIQNKIVAPVKSLLSRDGKITRDQVALALPSTIEGLAVYTQDRTDEAETVQYRISFQEADIKPTLLSSSDRI